MSETNPNMRLARTTPGCPSPRMLGFAALTTNLLLRRFGLMGDVRGEFRAKRPRTRGVHGVGAAHRGGAVGCTVFAFFSGNTACFGWHRTCDSWATT